MPGNMRDALQTPEQAKLSYVETQIEEMQAIVRRNEVDIFINNDIEWPKEEQLGVATQIDKLEKENVKLTKAVESLTKLKSQLEA